jgi:hypothetical protein
MWREKYHRPRGEIGRHASLRGWCPYGRAGSSPVVGTKAELGTERERSFTLLFLSNKLSRVVLVRPDTYRDQSWAQKQS